MMYFYKTIIAVVSFAILDFLWIGLLFKNLYAKLLTPAIGAMRFNLAPALFVYILLGLGVSVFSAKVGVSPLAALGLGAVLGLITYGVYDGTNLATIANWPFQFAALDIFWGTFATAIVSFFIAYVFAKF